MINLLSIMLEGSHFPKATMKPAYPSAMFSSG
jgi:hypothetical protein